jgi:hypothetical protein
VRERAKRREQNLQKNPPFLGHRTVMVHILPANCALLALAAIHLHRPLATALNMADMDGFEPAPPSSFDWGSDDEGDEGSGDGSDSLTVPSFTAAKGGSFVVPTVH